ncbi:IS607 family element RNA-guided endonuclease TnpB [Rhodococcus sp. BH5]|uniref:IS607 family element RNA-guided endonuclease TnpB n=1 Tax=Rhodococcus sp. BH5 TaxID=2871702 RepID=UPI0022CD5E69|nr:IS607 family element RNA-guided endonuclease TnpB [Rhodococcus sp. BH5]MCZ9635304.1 IS607 family element RNA-guided endonuclease TnpB [Rhodococcus sp. BH5]
MARFEVPEGWTVQAYMFALDPTAAQVRAFRSHAGGARKAHNTMLALVKAVMDQRAAERSYGIAESELTPSLNWSLAGLRKQWNARKDAAAPWWAENSKEAYNTGLDGLARGLNAWSAVEKGERAGKAVGFPQFKTVRSRRSVRFTTGAIRVEASRHHVTLPRIGRVKTHESTRKLARRVEVGTGRILSATVSEDAAGRWRVAFQVLVQRAVAVPGHVGAGELVVGVDVGVKADSLLVVATPDGREVARVPAPKSLTAAQSRLRALQRRAARQQGPYDTQTQTKQTPSKRWARQQRRINRTHAQAAAIRRDVLHKQTTRLAQRHQVIVVETLNASGMRSAGGRRKKGLNRALADAALAEIRRMLGYKTRWYGSHLVAADRWFASSKTCSGCGGRKPSLSLAERTYVCEHCGLVIDRDLNAAINLARLGGTLHAGQTRTSTGSSPAAAATGGNGRGATQETETTQVVNAAGREASTRHNTSNGVDPTGTASPQGEAA